MRLSVIDSALLSLRIYTRADLSVIKDGSVVMVTPSVCTNLYLHLYNGTDALHSYQCLDFLSFILILSFSTFLKI